MLLKQIEQDFQKALKAGEADHLSVLRSLRTALHNKEIELRPKDEELTYDLAVQVVKQEVKKRKEAVEMYEKGERTDLAEKEKKELDILSQYLPEQLSDGKIKEIVLKVIKQTNASGPQDFGKIMGAVMVQIKGQADGNKVREILQEQLNNLTT